jgi:hypothetical protein
MLKIVDEMSSLKCELKCDENVVKCCRMLKNMIVNVKNKLTNVGVQMLNKCYSMSAEM